MDVNKKTIKPYSGTQVAKKVIDFCLRKYKFIYLSGNGGSGKTTLSNELVSEIKSRGLEVNCIDMDEFVLDTKMRKSGKKVWVDVNNNTRESEYTTSFRESYYLNAVEAIIYSINKGKDSYFKTKKSNQFIEIKAQAPITIIEGVGTAFLEKNINAFGVFLTCNSELEIRRRINRSRDGENNLSSEEVEKKCNERNEQFEAMILPEGRKFDLELSSQEDYLLDIMRDNLSIFKS